MQNVKLTAEQEMAARTRRSFLTLGAAGVIGVGGWAWLVKQPDIDGVPGAFRKVLGFNEGVVRNTLYGNGHLAPTFPASAITEQKSNGDEGIDDVADDYSVEVVPYGSSSSSQKLTLEAIKALPKHEQIIEFKCVEGWSAVSRWAGARMSDFTAKFAPGSEKAAFVGMMTPNQEYYVGLDTPSALHPQTLLAWEYDGKPLEVEHGAPLRLIVPVKYGIKNIKQIARIEYTDQRPKDFWHERGYDYYSGL